MKTIAGTMSVILLSSLMSIVKIQNKGAKLGTMSPMDQVLWRTYLLEASLMDMSSIFSFCDFLFVYFTVFLFLVCMSSIFLEVKLLAEIAGLIFFFFLGLDLSLWHGFLTVFFCEFH